MRITCPSCAAEYNLPAPVPPGRMVRCARCGGEWVPVAAAAVAAVVTPPPALPAPEPAQPRPFLSPPAENRPPAVVRKFRPAVPGRVVLALAWVGSVAAVAGLVAAAYVFRPAIMHAWPASTRLYAAFGLA